MASRLSLQVELESILGSRNVYFQPPESFKLHYPAIIYKKNPYKTEYANNKPYVLHNSYVVTAIYTDPDSDLPKKIASMEKCRSESNYMYDGLYYSVYVLYH